MRDNLAAGIALVLRNEGGWSNDPNDAGGMTQFGITHKTLSAVRGRPVSAGDMQALTQDEAAAIYAKQYAAPIRFDDLPDGLDVAVFDCSVNAGPTRAAKILQGLLGFTGDDLDGFVGVQTLDAVKGRSVSRLVRAYCDARLVWLQSLVDWQHFGRGWTTRVRRVEAEALRLAMSGTMAGLDSVADEPGGGEKAEGSVKLRATGSGKAAIATVATTVASVGMAASQASGVLEQFSDVAAVRWVLLACACASAAGVLAVALQRAGRGAVT